METRGNLIYVIIAFVLVTHTATDRQFASPVTFECSRTSETSKFEEHRNTIYYNVSYSKKIVAFYFFGRKFKCHEDMWTNVLIFSAGLLS